MREVDKVISTASAILRNEWVPNCAVDVATRKATGKNGITGLWQKYLCGQNPDRYRAEFPVCGRTRIDLVDVIEGIAYELKVSPKDPDHEFYKDIFKIWIHNLSASGVVFKEFYFITPEKGVRQLEKGLAAAVSKLPGKFGFSIKVVCV